MKKTLLLLMVFASHQLVAQNVEISNKWNIRVSHAKYENAADFSSSFRAELNYGFVDNLKTGVYFGVGWIDLPYDAKEIQPNLFSYSVETRIALQYGINIRYNFLPLFVNAGDYRFELYAVASFGSKTIMNVPENYEGLYFSMVYPDGTEHFFIEEYYPNKKFDPEFGAGFGATFYLTRKMGAFCEMTWGKFHYSNSYYKDNSMFRFGLSFKF